MTVPGILFSRSTMTCRRATSRSANRRGNDVEGLFSPVRVLEAEVRDEVFEHPHGARKQSRYGLLVSHHSAACPAAGVPGFGASSSFSAAECWASSASSIATSSLLAVSREHHRRGRQPGWQHLGHGGWTKGNSDPHVRRGGGVGGGWVGRVARRLRNHRVVTARQFKCRLKPSRSGKREASLIPTRLSSERRFSNAASETKTFCTRRR